MFRKLIIYTLFISSTVITGFQLRNPTNIFVRFGSSLLMSDVEEATPSVFIGNLPFTMDEDSLKSLVESRVSNLMSVTVAKDKKTGKPRGFGFLKFNEQKDVESAVASLAGLEVDGRAIVVDLTDNRKKQDKPPGAASTSNSNAENNVYIGNLDFTTTNDQVMSMCDDILGAGVAKKVRILTDRETGRSRGFGYVEVATPDDISKAISLLNGIKLNGRDLRVDTAQRRDQNTPRDAPAPRSDRPPMRTERAPRQAAHSVFLGNLAWDVSQEMLEEMLNDVVGVGSFTRVRLAYDRETSKPRGFAHIDFKDLEVAEKAIVELNGIELLGRQLRADHAQRKE